MDFLIQFHSGPHLPTDKAEVASDILLAPLRLAFGKKYGLDSDLRTNLSQRTIGVLTTVLFLPLVILLTAAGITTLLFSHTHKEKCIRYHQAHDHYVEKLLGYDSFVVPEDAGLGSLPKPQKRA